jgi:hypothetical protein
VYFYKIYAREIHAYKIYAYKVYPYEMHAREVHAHKTYVYEIHALKMHARKGLRKTSRSPTQWSSLGKQARVRPKACPDPPIGSGLEAR